MVAEELAGQNKTVYEWLAKYCKEGVAVDAIGILAVARSQSRKINIVLATGPKEEDVEVWTSDDLKTDDIIIVYFGDGRYMQTKVGNILINFRRHSILLDNMIAK